MIGDGQPVRLECDGSGYERTESCAEIGRKIPLGLDQLDARHRAGGLHIASVGQEKRPFRVHEQGCIRAREPGEVANVDRRRDENGVHAELRQPRSQPLQTTREAHRWLASHESASW